MKCNVTACDREAHPLLVHKDNGKAYCVRCARNINEYAAPVVLIPWPTRDEILAHDVKSMQDRLAERVIKPMLDKLVSLGTIPASAAPVEIDFSGAGLKAPAPCQSMEHEGS